MKKFICISLFLLGTYSLCAQTLTLTGKVFSHIEGPGNKMFYAFNHSPMDTSQFISYKSDKIYKWSMKIEDIHKYDIKMISFTRYTGSTNCPVRYTIRLNQILADSSLNTGQDIEIYTDLILYFSCGMGRAYSIDVMSPSYEIPGNYTLENDSTLIEATLHANSAYRYVSFIKKSPTKVLFDEEYGNWILDSETNTITFYIWVIRNKSTGIMKKVQYKRVFKPVEGEDGIYHSGQYLLLRQ